MLFDDPSPAFLAPVTLEAFLERFWGRERLVLQRNDETYFKDFLTMGALDRLVTSTRIPLSNFNLAKGDAPLPFAEYARGGDFVDRERALALHKAGATIILRSVEQWSASLNRLRIMAETAFRCEAQVNVYLTPADNKSTPPHWDTHDLFVLQIEGEKVWRIFDGERTLPLSDERFRVGEDAVSQRYEEILLRPGDTLYLPRGVIHEPIAQSYSVHVALGVHSVRWFDVLEVALQLLAQRNGGPLREAAPGWAEGRDPVASPGLVDDLCHPTLLAEAAAVLRQRFERARAKDLAGRLSEIRRGPRLETDARYARRSGISLDAARMGEGVSLRALGQEVRVGPALEEAVAHILSHGTFVPRDLPGRATLEERTALCVALQEIGVLATVAGEAH